MVITCARGCTDILYIHKYIQYIQYIQYIYANWERCLACSSCLAYLASRAYHAIQVISCPRICLKLRNNFPDGCLYSDICKVLAWFQILSFLSNPIDILFETVLFLLSEGTIEGYGSGLVDGPLTMHGHHHRCTSPTSRAPAQVQPSTHCTSP